MENYQPDGYAEGEEPLIFYHEKGEFRKYYEGDHLKDLATGKENPRKGFFKCLVATKANRMIFTGMMMCFALVFILYLFGKKGNEGTVDGMFCDLSSFSFQDEVFASVEVYPSFKTRRMHIGDYEDKVFDVVFTVIDSDGNEADVAAQRFFYESPEGEHKFIRGTFGDYDSVKVKCNITVGGSQIELISAIQQK